MVEWYNASLKNGLRKYIERFGGQWNKCLPYLLFAFRDLPHSPTRFISFEFVFSRNHRGPMAKTMEENARQAMTLWYDRNGRPGTESSQSTI